ncbi:hypothetical protein Acr_01g0010700 [Actinidia rufa]|uniref:Uncharacterized protein n=1 Tax=Actinidia rufa TaxID=165716 RepID=A0A7J0E434_9ERIC|nr:hypothetical protein Acr_01g0010700 [Actinidia rufa]
MEGLLPMVYKTLKKNKTRRKYECLSSGAAQAYNISDFYAQGYMNPEPQKNGTINGGFHVESTNGHHHRRHKSFSVPEDDVMVKPKQLVRFRSHRLFSCVTGA